jgi:hypothetical protein
MDVQKSLDSNYFKVFRKMTCMWRPFNFTPIHSPTGPVGQPLLPVYGVSASRPGDAQTHNGTGFLLLRETPTRLINGLVLGSVPTMGSFTRLVLNDVKSQLWSHMPSPVPFHSLQALLLRDGVAATYGLRSLMDSKWCDLHIIFGLAPVKLLEGCSVEILQFHSNTQYRWSHGSTVCFLSRGSAGHVPGMHKLTREPGFSC